MKMSRSEEFHFSDSLMHLLSEAPSIWDGVPDSMVPDSGWVTR